jgi:FixJ family two-component response regulator
MPTFHIIDDEPDLCELAVELIASAGFKAVSYTNPVEYLDYMNSDGYVVPTAIFTDVQMPEMNGYELCDEIKKKHPDQKIVVVSGYSGVEAFKRKVWQFLPKPYMPEQIIAIVNAIVQYNAGETQASSLKPQASSLKPQ